MATKADLKLAIDRLLSISSVGALLNLNSDTPERAFEGYVFALCGKAVERAGGQAVLTGRLTGAHPATIILRGAPGHMSSDAQDFCYLNCELNNKKFEIHLDVEYEGSSKAIHEIDISFYDKASADNVRSKGTLPKTSGKLIMIFECKFYTHSIPSTSLARGFIGLLQDCNSSKLNAFVSNNASENLKKYMTNKPAEPFVDLSPLRPNSEERFIYFVEQKLRKWAP